MTWRAQGSQLSRSDMQFVGVQVTLQNQRCTVNSVYLGFMDTDQLMELMRHYLLPV